MVSSKNFFKKSIESWLLRRLSKNISTNSPFGENISIGSSLGLVRKENQDRAIISKFNSRSSEKKSYLVFALADGMGGMAEGAQCAAMSLSIFLSELINSKENNLSYKLCSATNAANNAVFDKYKGAGGTTLSAILFDSFGGKSAVNIGDSRIYHIERKGNFKQISIDDTIDGQLAAIKKEPSRGPESNQLVQYIGMGDGLEPQEVKLLPKFKMSHLLLTSDGAHCVGKTILNTLFENAPNITSFVLRLLNLAEWHGGKDNATSICFSVDLIKNIFQMEKESDHLVQVWDSYGKLDCLNYLFQPDILQNNEVIESNKISRNKSTHSYVSDINHDDRLQSKEKSRPKNNVKNKKKASMKKSKPQDDDNAKKQDEVQLEVIDYIKKNNKK